LHFNSGGLENFNFYSYRTLQQERKTGSALCRNYKHFCVLPDQVLKVILKAYAIL